MKENKVWYVLFYYIHCNKTLFVDIESFAFVDSIREELIPLCGQFCTHSLSVGKLFINFADTH